MSAEMERLRAVAADLAQNVFGPLPDNWADICQEQLDRNSWSLPELCGEWIMHSTVIGSGHGTWGEWGDVWEGDLMVMAHKIKPMAAYVRAVGDGGGHEGGLKAFIAAAEEEAR